MTKSASPAAPSTSLLSMGLLVCILAIHGGESALIGSRAGFALSASSPPSSAWRNNIIISSRRRTENVNTSNHRGFASFGITNDSSRRHRGHTNYLTFLQLQSRGGDAANDDDDAEEKQLQQNTQYIKGLIDNLEGVLDKWIKTGTMATRRRAYNIHQQITRLSMDEKLIDQATRLVKRASMPLDPPPPVPPTEHIPADQQQATTPASSSSCGGGVSVKTGTPTRASSSSSSSSGQPTTYTDTSASSRKDIAKERQQWEEQHFNKNAFLSRMNQDENVPSSTDPFAPKQPSTSSTGAPRSALSARMEGKGDPFVSSVMSGGGDGANAGLDPFAFAEDKKSLQDTMKSSISSDGDSQSTKSARIFNANVPSPDFATAKASELIARAGSGSAFEGSTLGIGGLDDVLSQIQRRVWIPLAAPPSLLGELGIQPVRGLLLYGSPGCGKTLLARKLGSILSPARPITIVSGPEILDKFVGSSEKNLRELFDNPPELYFEYKKNYGEALDKTALHVIVLDEFDAIARTRGGSSGKGDQGDAGVARDSVVNQLLAKMDGIDGLGVPTLLIGLTNQPWLIDPALMRPGRFEVQIEVPKPRTVEQRVSILQVHTESMMRSGRVLASDAPEGSPAWRRMQVLEAIGNDDSVLTYSELLDLIAIECDGMSGASLAGVARAAASRALERAVTDFAGHVAEDDSEEDHGNSIADCLVTQEDFEKAIEDVFESARGGEYTEKDGKDSFFSKSSKGASSDDISEDDIAADDDSSTALSGGGSESITGPADDETTGNEEMIQPDTPYIGETASVENIQTATSFKSSNLKNLLPVRQNSLTRSDKFPGSSNIQVVSSTETSSSEDVSEIDTVIDDAASSEFDEAGDETVDDAANDDEGIEVDEMTDEPIITDANEGTKIEEGMADEPITADTNNQDTISEEGVTDEPINEETNEETISDKEVAEMAPDTPYIGESAEVEKSQSAFKGSNLKSLLPTRKMTWMKLDKLGRRIEVDPEINVKYNSG